MGSSEATSDQPFKNLPARSLEAIKCVGIDSVFQAASKARKLDWKYASLWISLKWVVRLFWGAKSQQDLDHCEIHLLDYFEAIRSRGPILPEVISKRRDAVISVLKSGGGGGGVLDSLFASELSTAEAIDNALNAAVAAFDAAQ